MGQSPASIVSVDPSSTTTGGAELSLSVSVIVCAIHEADAKIKATTTAIVFIGVFMVLCIIPNTRPNTVPNCNFINY